MRRCRNGRHSCAVTMSHAVNATGGRPSQLRGGPPLQETRLRSLASTTTRWARANAAICCTRCHENSLDIRPLAGVTSCGCRLHPRVRGPDANSTLPEPMETRAVRRQLVRNSRADVWSSVPITTDLRLLLARPYTRRGVRPIAPGRRARLWRVSWSPLGDTERSRTGRSRTAERRPAE
jgi:hypothetical protein